EIYERLEELIHQHQTTLIFVNTRRLAERVAHHLGELLGEGAVTCHHGSLARETRLDAEKRLKEGRLRALVATAIAEYFANLGLNIMLMMDSVTRVAMAQREIGLAIGEPPTTKGYTPSVFAFLPRLLERAGNFRKGSITGLYTVLVEGDDMNDPVADTVRSILDGHVVLSRKLAAAGQYPAVDVLQSISRVMIDVISKRHLANVNKVREILATYEEAEDLINIGAYVKGSNPRIDYAISMIDKIVDFKKQDMFENTTLEESVKKMEELLANSKSTVAAENMSVLE
ncbi:hypothetical protein IH824_10760, partial [candidate division KSB1 bacterium]|nr:hypothetical protein [candidate division KSB1 bacterium]